MGRKKCGAKEMTVPLLESRQEDYWGKESSVLLLKMCGMQLLGWERRSSRLSRTEIQRVVKKLGGVCLALRNVINVTGPLIGWLWRMLSGENWDDGRELIVLLKRWRCWAVLLISIMKNSWKYQNRSKRTSDFSWQNIVLQVLVNVHCFHWNQWSRRNLSFPNLWWLKYPSCLHWKLGLLQFDLLLHSSNVSLNLKATEASCLINHSLKVTALRFFLFFFLNWNRSF